MQLAQLRPLSLRLRMQHAPQARRELLGTRESLVKMVHLDSPVVLACPEEEEAELEGTVRQLLVLL